MTRTGDRLRKLLALYNDAASPAGEKAAVLAAIARLKDSVSLREFAEAERMAAEPDVADFVEHWRNRSTREGKRSTERKARTWADEKVREWQQAPQSTAQARRDFDRLWTRLAAKCREQGESVAYPSAYGDKE